MCRRLAPLGHCFSFTPRLTNYPLAFLRVSQFSPQQLFISALAFRVALESIYIYRERKGENNARHERTRHN